MRNNELSDVQLSRHIRIPDFKGAEEAAQRILQLEEFKRAKVIKINLDKPQAHIRLLALEANKEILVKIPRVKSGVFLHVVPGADTSEQDLKYMATRRGLEEFGKAVDLDSDIKVASQTRAFSNAFPSHRIVQFSDCDEANNLWLLKNVSYFFSKVDLVVLGSICVSRTGCRIGKGEGFEDLEFAVLMKMGAINSETPVVTTVHDCQILDSLPENIFEKHDVPVDIIVTPTQTLAIGERLKKPDGIYWEMLTQRRVKSMEILQQLHEKEKQDGKTITLKENDTSDERRPHERRWFRKPRSERRPKAKQEVTDSEDTPNAEIGEKPVKKPSNRESRRGRLPKRRPLRERKSDGDNEAVSVTENNENDVENETKPRRRKSIKSRARADIDFSLKLSNIKPDVRVRHLKNALLERGVRARHITWHGQRGYCYLHFGKLRNKDAKPDQPVQVDSIVANLQQLKLCNPDSPDSANEVTEEEYVVVEPAKPITRIEITDVTTV